MTFSFRKSKLDHGVKASGRRLVLVGDSRAAGASSRTYFDQAGTTISYENVGPLNWAKFVAGQPVDFIDIRDNFGVGGETSDEVLGRLQTALATGNVAAVWYRASTDDRGSADFTYAQTKANIDAAVTACRLARVMLIIEDEYPRGASVNTVSA